jgi:hypothetical protein
MESLYVGDLLLIKKKLTSKIYGNFKKHNRQDRSSI